MVMPITQEQQQQLQQQLQERFDALLHQAKASKQWSDNAISRRLGFEGSNGARDLTTVRAGRSPKVPLADAVRKLYEALTTDTTMVPKDVQPGEPIKKRADAAATATSVSKPPVAVHDDRKAPVQQTDEHDDKTDFGAWFEHVVAAVKVAKQWSDNDVSRCLGFSGKNGTRDLAAVRAGRSSTISPLAAITHVQATLNAAAAAAQPSLAVPVAADGAATADAAPLPTRASADAPDHAAAFDRAVAQLKTQKQWSDNDVSRFLGFAGKHGTRDLAAVRAGRSKKINVAAATATLQSELPAAH